jgi:hypothetical protein
MAAFRAALEDITESPGRPPREHGVRRFRVKGYPYHLIRDERSGLIIALAHTSRRPGYWRDRL